MNKLAPQREESRLSGIPHKNAVIAVMLSQNVQNPCAIGILAMTAFIKMLSQNHRIGVVPADCYWMVQGDSNHPHFGSGMGLFQYNLLGTLSALAYRKYFTGIFHFRAASMIL